MIDPLIAAAARAAGPAELGSEDAWLARVKRLAVGLHLLGSDLDAEFADLAKITPFTGTVVDFSINPRSTRGVVLLYTGTDQLTDGIPAGHERVQTKRGDTAEGHDQIEQVRHLVGHRVQVWKQNVTLASDKRKNFRELARLVDLGLDPERDAAHTPAASQPAREQGRIEPTPGAEDWPTPAGQIISEHDAKVSILDAANGDKSLALKAWEHIGSPQTSVSTADLAKALEFVGGQR